MLSAANAGQAAAAPVTASGSDRVPRGGFNWLAGDHHIHTQYSPDGQYRVIDHVRHANAYGLDWMVITDHGSVQHAKIGVEKVNPDIVAARSAIKDTLIFQGLEWNIPAAEHGTVFVHPGKNEVSVLKQFENSYDGVVASATANTPANETLALTGLHFLAAAVHKRDVQDALMLANHPARKGIDSPHEIRGWRDAEPSIAIGMEGAPGHQAAGIAVPFGPGSGRGFYDNSPDPAASFAGYPLESYRTFGGFDWMTATVGGLWDSLLAEGKPWWITANSDSHQIWADTSQRGPDSDFTTNGFFNDPVHITAPQLTQGDFWPGFYSRTHVGAQGFSYAAVMNGLRAGRVWVDHGALLDSLDVRLRAGGDEVTLGGVLNAKRGTPVTLNIRIQAALPAELVPVPARARSCRRHPRRGDRRRRRPRHLQGTRNQGRAELRRLRSARRHLAQLPARPARRRVLRPAAWLRRQPARPRIERRGGRSGRPGDGRRRRRRPVERPVVLHQPDVGAAQEMTVTAAQPATSAMSALVAGLDLLHQPRA